MNIDHIDLDAVALFDAQLVLGLGVTVGASRTASLSLTRGASRVGFRRYQGDVDVGLFQRRSACRTLCRCDAH